MSSLGRQPADARDGPRILITRLSAIGDCLQTLPVAWALRERFPHAWIAWAVEAAAAPLIACVPAIDQVLRVPKRMIASPTAAWQVRRQLLPWKFDLAIDPQGLSKSSAVGWLSGARRRIGFAGTRGREVSRWLNNELVASRRTHMVERYLELLQPLGIELPRPRFDLHLSATALETANAIVRQRDLTGGYAVVSPGAGWDSKRWPLERFAAIIRHLGERHALPTLIAWASQRERAWAEQIVRDCGGHALAAPQTSLVELAAILRGARLMIAADTGPLHLAAALGTPCVGIFGSTRREVCCSYGSRSIALQAAFDGSSGRKLPGADNWAVRRVTAAAVAEACSQLLESDRSPAAADRLCSNAH